MQVQSPTMPSSVLCEPGRAEERDKTLPSILLRKAQRLSQTNATRPWGKHFPRRRWVWAPLAVPVRYDMDFEWDEYNRLLLRRERMSLLDVSADADLVAEWHTLLMAIDFAFLRRKGGAGGGSGGSASAGSGQTPPVQSTVPAVATPPEEASRASSSPARTSPSEVHAHQPVTRQRSRSLPDADNTPLMPIPPPSGPAPSPSNGASSPDGDNPVGSRRRGRFPFLDRKASRRSVSDSVGRVDGNGHAKRRSRKMSRSRRKRPQVKFGGVVAVEAPSPAYSEDEDEGVAGSMGQMTMSDDDIRYGEGGGESSGVSDDEPTAVAGTIRLLPPALRRSPEDSTPEGKLLLDVARHVSRPTDSSAWKPPTYLTIRSKLVEEYGQDVFNKVDDRVRRLLKEATLAAAGEPAIVPSPEVRRKRTIDPPSPTRINVQFGPSHMRASCAGLNPTQKTDQQFVLSAAHTTAMREHARIVADDTLEVLLGEPGFGEWLCTLMDRATERYSRERDPRAIIWDFLHKSLDIPKQTTTLIVDRVGDLDLSPYRASSPVVDKIDANETSSIPETSQN
eukprot:m.126543 g.126543  ORF g.126543 m.126543 type:complete len:563 (-) comp11192_c0_seq1:156-1844(-)